MDIDTLYNFKFQWGEEESLPYHNNYRMIISTDACFLQFITTIIALRIAITMIARAEIYIKTEAKWDYFLKKINGRLFCLNVTLKVYFTFLVHES